MRVARVNVSGKKAPVSRQVNSRSSSKPFASSRPSSLRSSGFPQVKLSARYFAQQSGGSSGKKAQRETTGIQDGQFANSSNGLRIATQRTNSDLVTVGLYLAAGSAHETSTQNGIAHLAQRLAFSNGSSNNNSFSKMFEDLGASVNSYTGKEYTAFTATALKKDVPQVVQLLSEAIYNPQYSAKNLDAERNQILSEIKETDSNYDQAILEHLHAVSFQGTTHGQPILGSPETLESITSNDLSQFVQQHYTLGRSALVAVGNIDQNELAALGDKFQASTAKHSEDQNQNKGNQSRDVSSPRLMTGSDLFPTSSWTGSAMVHRDDEMPYVHIAWGYPAGGWNHPDFPVFLVMQAMIGSYSKYSGGGNNVISRLAENIALDHYGTFMSSFYFPYHNQGMWGIYGTCKYDTLEQFSVSCTEEPGRFAIAATNPEVDRAKQKVLLSLLQQFESPFTAAEALGRQSLSTVNKPSFEDLYQRIKFVNASAVQRVAKNFFYDCEISYAAMGPTKSIPDYNQMRDWTFWRRV